MKFDLTSIDANPFVPIKTVAIQLDAPEDVGGEAWDQIRFGDLPNTPEDRNRLKGSLERSRDRDSSVSDRTPLYRRQSDFYDHKLQDNGFIQWHLMKHDWDTKQQVVGSATVTIDRFEFLFCFRWKSVWIDLFVLSDEWGSFHCDESTYQFKFYTTFPYYARATVARMHTRPMALLEYFGTLTAPERDPTYRPQCLFGDFKSIYFLSEERNRHWDDKFWRE